MAELVTVVRTYFKSDNNRNGNYRNNTIVIDIPDKAVIYVQQIFEAGFQHGVNSIFESTPNEE